MISSIEFDSVEKSKKFSYASEVEFFKTRKKLEFTPGLNILFGPNGCGKSTILRMIAMSLAAEQGGVSTITSSWAEGVFDRFESRSTLDGIRVHHDGQPILYGNPRNATGLIGGTAFDDDFMNEGLANSMSKDSTGWTTMRRLLKMIATLEGDHEFPSKFAERILKKSLRPEVQGLLAASIPVGPKTMLFDEPESGLAIPVQRNVLNSLFAGARKDGYQVIVATHSLFALGLPGANYIEMKEGYVQAAEDAVRAAALQLELMQKLKEIRLDPKFSGGDKSEKTD
jgi:predicted ATPase